MRQGLPERFAQPCKGDASQSPNRGRRGRAHFGEVGTSLFGSQRPEFGGVRRNLKDANAGAIACRDEADRIFVRYDSL